MHVHNGTHLLFLVRSLFLCVHKLREISRSRREVGNSGAARCKGGR
jgi:hypothetical protein